MEDAHTTVDAMEESEDHAFFGVFDGHGGPNVAKYCGTRLHRLIGNDGAFKRKDYEQAIKNGFLGIDNEIRAGILFADVQIRNLPMKLRDARL